jgi:excisionase family DNA binding protein
MEAQLLTPDEVANILRIKPTAVYELTRKRNKTPLPFLRIAGKLRFTREAINRWLSQLQTVEG